MRAAPLGWRALQFLHNGGQPSAGVGTHCFRRAQEGARRRGVGLIRASPAGWPADRGPPLRVSMCLDFGFSVFEIHVY